MKLLRTVSPSLLFSFPLLLLRSTAVSPRFRQMTLALACAAVSLIAVGCGPRTKLPTPQVRAFHTQRTTQHVYEPVIPTRPTVKDNGLPKLPPVTIIVDPGHGGHATGTPGLGRGWTPEKNIVLPIGKELADLLRDCGARVVMSRSDDRFIELDDRAALADRHRADLLVSIHADAADSGEPSGSTVYIARGALPASSHAARCIENSLAQGGVQSRGIHEADFRVLVKHSRPAVLVECGFLTNLTDAKRLNQQEYRKRIAWLIARGIVRHFQ